MPARQARAVVPPLRDAIRYRHQTSDRDARRDQARTRRVSPPVPGTETLAFGIRPQRFDHRGGWTRMRPPATSTTAAAKAGVNGSCSTRLPAATPKSGAKNVKADNLAAE